MSLGKPHAVADSKKSGLFAGHRSYFPRRPIRFPDLSCAVSPQNIRIDRQSGRMR
jgi:hypothetical protein